MSELDRYIKKTTMADVRKYASTGTRLGLPFKWFAEVEPVTDAGDFIEGLLISGGASVLYGESNAGKTFAAVDLALSVASGNPWQGRQVDQGPVLYLALEGGNGIANRIAAYRQHHGIADDLPFAMTSNGVDLTDDNGAVPIIDTAYQILEDTGDAVRLIVIDTLSRSLCGGDENSSADMGALVRNVDAIRQETGAHVMLVHHAGKDLARGARGHSLLRAAIDTEIQVSRSDSGAVVARVEKQRDLPSEGEFAFVLEPVTLGTDHRGNPVRSCVVAATVAPKRSTAKAKMTDIQKAVLDEVKNAVADHGQPVRPRLDMDEVIAIPRNRLRNHFERSGLLPEGLRSNQASARISKWLTPLKGKDIIAFTAEYIWFVDQPATTGNQWQPSDSRDEPVADATGNPRNHTL